MAVPQLGSAFSSPGLPCSLYQEEIDSDKENKKENEKEPAASTVCKRLFSDFEELDSFQDQMAFKRKAVELVRTPQKYYPFSRKENGRVAVVFTPSAKKSRVIYKIKNLQTGESYTGKTAQTLPDRTYGHHYGINHPERDAGDKELYEDIRQQPDQFVIGIQLEQEGTGASLELLEKVCIAANGSFEQGYNSDRGGGGGTSPEIPTTPPRTPKLTREQAKTPVKGYTLDYDENGKIRVLISPHAKKTRSVIYGFKNIRTGEWLIGETEQEVGKRLSGYYYAFDHPSRDCGKLPLPSEVRLFPEDFQFYILQKDVAHPKTMEKAWIEAKDSCQSGYNQNAGGGGSGSC